MSSEDAWGDDASSDEDYHYAETGEEEENSEQTGADDDDDEYEDPSPFLNPGLTQQLLQGFTNTSLIAILNGFVGWEEEGEEDYGLDQLLYDEAEFEFAIGEPSGNDDTPNSMRLGLGNVAGAVRVPDTNRYMLLSRDQLRYLLRHDMLNDLPTSPRLTRDEFQEWMDSRRPDPNRFPKVPSEAGRELMYSGQFGANPSVLDQKMKKYMAMRVLDRELGIPNPAEKRRNQKLLVQSMIPSGRAETVIHFQSPVYSGQFSDDGDFFFACGHDFRVRLYDTSNPYAWKHYKTVDHPYAQWTLTDASLSPDNRWLAYTSLTPSICLTPTDPQDEGDPYTLDLGGNPTPLGPVPAHFGIMSVRFSGDGRELIAGTNANAIAVYDIETRQTLHWIKGHNDDVNAVCFADKSSPHILYSGSDDSMIKVWDRRSMGDRREAGAFVGHTEGITYIDSKDDGRYILSNGKDQSMKLWDLRMAMSTDKFRRLNIRRATTFDYRWQEYNESYWHEDPNDNSVVTFRSHKVLRTLIRCHFSPPGSSDSRYVYSGSHDGKVYIWNLDATLAGTIDVTQTTFASLSRTQHAPFSGGGGRPPPPWQTLVRDASWHPTAPVIVASAWNGIRMHEGTCSLYRFNEEASAPGYENEDEDDIMGGICVTEKMRPIPCIR
ncbi:related to WD repeat protein [Cephalotrichum gorgonifer]|uniref:Related to WD repeat protein n=1 Tax=Cephalotrichum gorgonifer TaxID=2041049 RepID=A0AAE8SWG6_9PEZI|nr:related to WD repeat protein [Cephalotrichum gorgonifer]